MEKSFFVEIGSFARTGDPLRTMLLAVLCAGSVSEVERLQTQLGSRPVNGDWTPYPFLRKTACQFGWDWGPHVASSVIVGIVMLHA
jgi:beta-mannosidase